MSFQVFWKSQRLPSC